MKKLAFLLLLLLFSATAEAKIETEADKFDSSIAYKSSTHIRKWSSVDWYFFIKHIDAKENETYWIRFMTNGYRQAPEKAEINVDGRVFQLTPEKSPNQYQRAVANGMDKYFNVWIYPLDQNTISAISKMKTAPKLRFIFAEKKPLITAFRDENLEEILKIITLKAADYDKYK